MIPRYIGRRLSAAIIAGAAVLAATPAGARPGANGPLYDYYYYDDAAHTTQVGYEGGVCYSFGPGVGPMQGHGSAYYEVVLVGECRNGQTIYQ